MSFLYILYQFIVIGFSMLGPGIIFSMLVFAQVRNWSLISLYLSVLLPSRSLPSVLIQLQWWCIMPFPFSSTSLLASSWNHQSNYSSLRFDTFLLSFSINRYYSSDSIDCLCLCDACSLSGNNESDNHGKWVFLSYRTPLPYRIWGVLAPTSLFIVTMVGIFAGAALLHPQECSNIVHGTVFFLLIPSTYVFLSLYSLINLNVINWGTREAVAKAMGKVFPSLSNLSYISSIG